MPTLPIWRTVIDAYLMLLQDIKGVLLTAWLPFLLVFLTGVVLGFLSGFIDLDPALYSLGVGLVTTIMVTFFTIAMHRRFLFGAKPDTGRVLWRFGAAERLFFGMVLALFLLVGAGGLAMSLSNMNGVVAFIFIAAVLTFGAITAAGALALPAAVDGHPHPVKVGWNLGRGVRLRLYAIVILTGLPVSIINGVASRSGVADTIVGGLAVAALYYVTAAMTVAGLCIAYKNRTAGLEITNPLPADSTPASTTDE